MMTSRQRRGWWFQTIGAVCFYLGALSVPSALLPTTPRLLCIGLKLAMIHFFSRWIVLHFRWYRGNT